jgi:hypothetical protein
MSYSLKGTGIPAAYNIKACLVVDDDNSTIVDLKGNAITRDGAVTVSAGSWNGNTRRYFSTFGSGFSPQAISWNTALSIATGGGAGFSVYAAFHSVNSGIGTGWSLLAESGAANRVNAVLNAGGAYKPSHEFSSSEFYVASTAFNISSKMSLLCRGIQGGAQSTRGANHGSALASLGSGSDPGFMPGTWSPNQLCGQPSNNYLTADIYAILVIQGQLSDADADLLHTDWFAELIGGSSIFSASAAETAAALDAMVVLQMLRPSVDTVPGNWTALGGGAMFSQINEVVRSDASYDLSGVSPTNDGYRTKLSSGALPVATAGGFHVISYALSSIGAASSAVVKLWQGNGVTLIASFSHPTVPSSFTQYDQALTSTQMALITDATDLYYEVIAS